MRKNFVPKYSYFTNGKNTVVAVASYAGKRVRGVAKCSDKDEFDLAKGEKLAAARCNLTIAKMREKNLQFIAQFRQRVLENVNKEYLKCANRAIEATCLRQEAEEQYKAIMDELM